MPVDLLVRRAGFSPVKGTRHLSLDRVELDEEGPVGDRGFCLVDPEQARVLRTVQNPSLIGVVARLRAGALELTLPTGESVSAPPSPTGEAIVCDYWGRQVDVALTDGPHAGLVSGWLGRDVRLGSAPRGGVVYGESVTIVGTASLAHLGESVGRAGLVDEAARFRATFVVETDEPYVEDSWLGQEASAGAATLRIGAPIPRCAVIDRHPETGEKDLRLLKALVQQRPTNTAGEPMFGVYATCTRPGEVEVTR